MIDRERSASDGAETDSATIELPSSIAGTVQKIHVKKVTRQRRANYPDGRYEFFRTKSKRQKSCGEAKRATPEISQPSIAAVKESKKEPVASKSATGNNARLNFACRVSENIESASVEKSGCRWRQGRKINRLLN